MQPEFSILIATWNAAATLPACLESIRAQEGARYEVLVADGASTDETARILEAHRDLFAGLVIEPDKGVYDAWNKIVPRAQGKWVLFLGADDVLAGPHVLARAKQQIEAMARPNTAYAYGQVTLEAGGSVIERFGVRPFPPGKDRVRRHRPFSHTALFHRRELFNRYGLFDPTFRVAGDSEFLTRTLKHDINEVIQLDLHVARMGQGGLSSSIESRLTAYLEDMRALRSHGHWLPPLPTLMLAGRAFVAVAIAKVFGRGAALKASNAYRRMTGRALRKEV